MYVLDMCMYLLTQQLSAYPLPEQLYRIQDDVRLQVRRPRASTRHVESDSVATTDQATGGDSKVIDLSKAAVRTTSHTTRINLSRGGRGRGREAVDDGAGSAAGEGQRGSDAESGSAGGLSSAEGDLDGERGVYALEESHGHVGEGAGADCVGRGTPGRHARVRGMHAEELVGVAEACGLTVVFADLEERGVGREVAGDVGGCGFAS